MAKSQNSIDQKSDSLKLPEDNLPIETDTVVAEPSSDEVAIRFVGQWNRLISTTNWEKGRIICQWREALMTTGVPVTQYSDEVWAQLVGYVTSQHAGRLRRVFQRFGDVFDQYEGLYWSHFQAALDWDDAEMWLEGAIQNQWSISQMRGKRWETLGTPLDQQHQEGASDTAALHEDSDAPDAAEDSLTGESDESAKNRSDQQTAAPITAVQTAESTDNDGASSSNGVADAESDLSTQRTTRTRQRLDVAIDDLPDDIAEAFEQFKLAIIAQRREGWQAISPDGVIECLDALKELVASAG